MEDDPFRYSCIEIPTVVGLLKNVLTQYPDNGQILKELVQNAEDAGATTFEVVYDARITKTSHEVIQRFVEGPAIYVYNDAVFTEDDWHGIRMLSDSIKKADLLKVGQFGLGFKSVFHFTDFVTIISGDNALFMDPNEPEATMCRDIAFSKLSSVLPKDDILKLWGSHLTKKHLSEEYFAGTIFWFPLRKKESKLSSNIYRHENVLRLFKSFSIEAPLCLTFLKSLENVSVKQNTEVSMKDLMLVNLNTHNLAAARKQRTLLKNELHICQGFPENPIICKYDITVDVKKNESISNQSFKVLQYLPTTPENARCKHMPLIGIAAPMNKNVVDDHTRGQIFCFLPLPVEKANNTNLPIQINGYFVLDQNRRHIKWRTEENLGDPDAEWNEALVSTILPEAYFLLLEEILKTINTIDIDTWYGLLPKIVNDATTGRWNDMSRTVWNKLLKLPIIYSHVKQTMMFPKDVISIAELSKLPEAIASSVEALLEEVALPIATIPIEVEETLTIFDSKPKCVNPSLLRICLRNNRMNKSWNRLHLLEYALSDGNYEDLNRIELLPLENGNWTTFTGLGVPVYLCNELESSVFIGAENQIVCTNVTPTIRMHLEKIASKGSANVQKFSPKDHLATLLPISVTYVQEYWNDHQQMDNWLMKVWQLVQMVDLQLVKCLPILPTSEELEARKFISLSSAIVFVRNPMTEVDECCAGALKLLNVNVLTSLPNYVRHPELHDYYCDFSGQGITQALKLALANQPDTMKIANTFNMNRSEKQRLAFCSKINEGVHFSEEVKYLLKNLLIFKTVGQSANISAAKVNELYPPIDDFPGIPPKPLILPCNSNVNSLALKLDCVQLSKEDLCLCALQHGNVGKEMERLGWYVLEDSNLCVSERIRMCLQSSKFILSNTGRLCRPNELYNPKDNFANALLGDDLVPIEKYNKHIEILKRLGLKSVSDLPKQSLISFVKQTENQKMSEIDRFKKIKALFLAINSRPDCSEICKEIEDFNCVYGISRPVDYPSNLLWATDTKLYKPRDVLNFQRYKSIVGSSQFLVECEGINNVAASFDWFRKPNMDRVLKHLKNLLKVCPSLDLLPGSSYYQYLRTLYSYLNDVARSSSESQLSGIPFVLTSAGFKQPSEIFVPSGKDDLQLLPYMHPLPFELSESKELFYSLGTFPSQSPQLCLHVLTQIRIYHETHEEVDVKHDLQIVKSVLQKLVPIKDKIASDQLILPVESPLEKLEFVEIGKCAYSDQDCDWLDCEELGVRVVERSIGVSLAKALGVQSLNKHLLADEESVMDWEQREPLTTRIHNLLRQYRDGVAVLKELIQNADDAGATQVCLLYDERQNLDSKQRYLTEQMKECQGPALWSYNDAKFTEEDFENLRKLGGGTKELSSTKIGKFGLGFCSVYNLTDVPSFVSGENYVIFDPHEKYLESNRRAGVRYNFAKTMNRIMLKKLNGQFLPFQNIFKCQMQEFSMFDGTLFRFPLRTALQANTSKLSNMSYSHDGMFELLSMFRQIVGQVLLFTQNVREVKVFYLPKDLPPENMKLLYKSDWHQNVTGGLNFIADPKVSKRVVEKASRLFGANHVWNGDSLKEIIVGEISVECTETGSHFLESKKGTSSITWFISWHSGVEQAFNAAKKLGGKVLPIASVALPVKINEGTFKAITLNKLPSGFYKESHLHCFLPLPVKADLPVHVNGYFEVASDRTSILTKTEDDRSTSGGMWNTVLMKDSVLNAYLNLLEFIKSEGLCLKTQFFSLWPPVSHNALTREDLLTDFSLMFYSTVRDRDLKVFRNLSGWYPLSKSYFLSEHFYHDRNLYAIAFEFMGNLLKDSDEEIIYVPHKIVAQFGSKGIDRIITEENFCREYFLPNLSSEYVSPEKRNYLLLHVIDSMVLFQENLINVACIPTMPNGKLVEPCNLIDPNSNLAYLFNESDERFPEAQFLQKDRRRILSRLGMKTHDLYKEDLFERIGSVVNIMCAPCMAQRSQRILDYFEGHKSQTKEVSAEVISMPFIPVMHKPKDWSLKWKGDEILPRNNIPCATHPKQSQSKILIGAPGMICSSEFTAIAGSSYYIHGCIPKTKYTDRQRKVYEILGIVTSVTSFPLKDVLLQLSEYRLNMAAVQPLFLTSACSEMYSYFNTVVREQKVDLRLQREEEILLTKKYGFVKPSLFAFKSEVDCAPTLFSAQHEGLYHYEYMLKSLLISNDFSSNTVHEVLMKKYNELCSCELPDEEIVLISRLTNILFRVSDRGISPCDLMLPDSKGILRPVAELCVDNGVHIDRGNFKYLHKKICYSQEMLNWLGIQEKTRKHLANLSHRMKFGQREPLTTRLKNILDNYPCDIGVMKELLQNADDAGATEIMYIADMRDHTTKKLILGNGAPLQGPALCVYNNKGFTKNDLEGIQNLGNSIKIEDPTSTGQYGIGFNAVYHLTDAPSFITRGKEIPGKETLCLFDPHCKYDHFATHESPGVMITDLEYLRKEYPCSFSGYPEYLLGEEGTIFRFPLRTYNSSIGPAMPRFKLNKLLDEFRNDMKIVLLFLKNIQKISICKVVDGKIVLDYSVESQSSDEGQNARLGEYMKKRRSIDNSTDYFFGMQQVFYSVSIKDSEEKEDEWIVGHQFGADNISSLPNEVIQAHRNKQLRLLPQCGVAICVKSKTPFPKNLYRNFCYLPLPAPTGFFMCLNGHFALDSARRSLWIGTCDFKSHWNDWLMQHILAPIVGEVVKQYRQLIFPQSKELMLSQYGNQIEHYHQLLPSVKNATSNEWKQFVKWFYQYVEKYELPIFDVFVPDKDVNSSSIERHSSNYTASHLVQRDNGKLHWHALHETGAHFPIYFAENDQESLANIMKRLGMKIGSHSVNELLKDAGIKLHMISPANVVEFLLSWKQNYIDKCQPYLKSEITSTPFLSIENVCKVFKYISMLPDLKCKLNNMPLLICSDKILRPFEENKPIILTNHSHLLPELGREFAHESLYTCIMELKILDQLMKVGMYFTLDKFAEKLSIALGQIYCNKLPGTMITLQNDDNHGELWIKRVWSYIIEEVNRCYPLNTGIDMTQGKHLILNSLGKCVLFPVTFKNQKFLVTIKESCQVLSLRKEDADIFHKLPVWHPNLKVNIPENLNLTTTLTNPTAVLEILYSCRTELGSISDRVNALLEYFASHCQNFALPKDKLRNLMIYRDAEGKTCNLHKNFIVPTFNVDLLSDINKLGTKAHILILKCPSSESVKRLFSYLDPNCLMNKLEIFTNFILDYIPHLTESECIELLEVLNEELQRTNLKSYSNFKPEEQSVVAKLKTTPFIMVNGQLRKADCFSDPYQPIFSAMKINCVLPKLWSDLKWNYFLRLAGMIHEVTPQMFIEFASSLSITDPHVKKKSCVLTEYLDKNLETLRSRIDEVKRIEFLVPDIDKRLDQLLSHYKTSSGLVSFVASIPSRYREIVWTTMPLLPSYATALVKKMHVMEQVPPEKLYQHICNVTTIIIHDEKVQKIMDQIYGELLRKDPNFLSMFTLNEIPIIHLPEKGRFVGADIVVLNLSIEIEPYLYRVPLRYGRHITLLQKLGVRAEVHPDNFVMVLKSIHDISKENELHPEEAKCMKMAMEGLTTNFSLLQHITSPVLYLPSKKGTLTGSSSMYVSDNNEIERALGSEHLKYPLFVGLEALEIEKYSVDFVKNLPERLRPRFLSEAVQQCFKGNFEFVELAKVEIIENFIYSREFMHGIIRVLRHYNSSSTTMLFNEDAIPSALSSVKVKAVKKLAINLILDGQDVGQRTKLYLVEDESGNKKSFILYVAEQVKPRHINKGLVELFGTLLGVNDHTNFIKTLTDMMTCINCPQDIFQCLDEGDIRSLGYEENPYEFYQTEVGTYLNRSFIPLLDNAYCIFHDKEIVAMKKYIMGHIDSEEDLIYVIVQVKYRVKASEKVMFDVYAVQTEKINPSVTQVEAHKLYKFMRDKKFSGSNVRTRRVGVSLRVLEERNVRDMVPSNNVFVEDEEDIKLSEEEIMKKVREQVKEIWKNATDDNQRRHMLRRIYLLWHPDKNPDNADVCTRVMQYIQSLVRRLENGEKIPDNDDPNSSSKEPPSEFYSETFKPPFFFTRRSGHSAFGRSYRHRQHRSNSRCGQDYNNSHHTNNNSYQYRQDSSKIPDRLEAKKWMRQAEHDYQQASSIEGKSACWTLYMCYQAAEKALKAALYSEDCEKALEVHTGSQTHNLSYILSLMSQCNCKGEIRNIERAGGICTNFLYPSHAGPPCDRFGSVDVHSILNATRIVKETMSEKLKC